MNPLSFLRSQLSPEALGKNLDSIIGIVSPDLAQKRLKSRLQQHTQARLYEGATLGRRADGWRPLDAGPKEGMQGLKLLRDRSRDFSRNNGYAKKAVGAICSNTVGTGIVLQFRAEGAKRRVDKANEVWKRWFHSVDCDFEGIHTGPALQNLMLRTVVEAGEVFLRKRQLSSDYYKETGKFPLQLQLLEPEFLDESKDTLIVKPGQNQIISGIEFDGEGRRVAYHIYTHHPKMNHTGFAKSVRVPASEIVHLYRVDRPGQLRGIPWGASIFLNLKDLDGYEDAELMRRKIASCFAGFITEPETEDPNINGTDPTANPPLVDRLEPGILEILPPGKTITFGSPPQVQGYDEYANSILHKIACGYEVPFAVLTGNLAMVNFSSGRMGFLEFQRIIEQIRWNLLIPRAMEPVRAWFAITMELIGFGVEGLDHEWTCPRREMIDPQKEVDAILLMVKAGLVSMPEAIKELGYDPETNIAEIKAWNKDIDAAKVILDSDPRNDPKRLAAENVAMQRKLNNNVDKSQEQ